MLKISPDAKILIIDDVSDNIQVVMNILREENYQFSFATDGLEALELIANESFDLILLDIMMPKLDGFEVCRRIKSKQKNENIPVIFLTAKADVDSIEKGFEVGAVDYLVKPIHSSELLARVRTHVELYRSRLTLEENNLQIGRKAERQGKRLIAELEENQREMIYVLMEMMECTSDETGQHIRRVAETSRLLAHYTDFLTEEDEMVIFNAAPMHDIGKVAIPTEILNKPGRLTEEEFSIMKTHTEKGKEFLRFSHRRIMKGASIIASQHHEKWNGTGYPNGLKGEEIHIYGRIVAIADVFDALTHKRQYKSAWTVDDAVKYIIEHEGSQFDPMLVKIFIEHLPEFIEISQLK